MKRFIYLFLCLFIVINTSAQSIYDLPGKDIIIFDLKEESYIKNYVNCVYTEKAVKTKKFNAENLYKQSIWGQRIHIEAVEAINKGKKDEAIVITAKHQENSIGIYIPLRYPLNQAPYSSRWFTNVVQYASWTRVYELGRIRDLIIPYVDASKVDTLLSLYKNKIIYPVKSANSILKNRDEMNSYSRNFPDFILLGKPYVLIDISFDKENIYERTLAPCIHLKDMSGKIIKFTVGSSTLETQKNKRILRGATQYPSPLIEDFSDFFYTESELILASTNKMNPDSIAFYTDKWSGKDVFVSSKNDEICSTYSNEPTVQLSLDNKFKSYGAVPRGYYTVEKFALMPSDANRPYMLYFALLKGEQDKIAIPVVNGFDKNIMLASEKKALDEKTALEEEARTAQWAKEEREEHDRLVKKFGASNARLIEDGIIRLGFTKSMVEEAWGSPSDVTTVTNQLGSIECWIYGLGSYVYFNKGRVIQIIN